jgi:hypothetical protein
VRKITERMKTSPEISKFREYEWASRKGADDFPWYGWFSSTKEKGPGPGLIFRFTIKKKTKKLKPKYIP